MKTQYSDPTPLKNGKKFIKQYIFQYKNIEYDYNREHNEEAKYLHITIMTMFGHKRSWSNTLNIGTQGNHRAEVQGT